MPPGGSKLHLKDQVAKVIAQAKLLQQTLPQFADPNDNVGFLERHQERMRYGYYCKRGWFIGSGVVEAGCKTVIGSRCKQSGMFWSEPGAENILALRCIHHSRRLDEFWKHRLNTHAARNDCLPLKHVA